MYLKLKFLLLVCLFFLSACTSFVVPDVDLTEENYPTKFKISEDEIYTKKMRTSVEDMNFIVIVNQSSELSGMRKKTDEFMTVSLDKMGFKKVLSENEFLQLIYKQGLHKNVIDIYSHKSLARIYEKTGSFLLLVAEFGSEGHGKVKIKIFDPEIDEPVFKLNTSAFVFSYDEQVLYPTVNAINDWYKASQ